MNRLERNLACGGWPVAVQRRSWSENLNKVDQTLSFPQHYSTFTTSWFIFGIASSIFRFGFVVVSIRPACSLASAAVLASRVHRDSQISSLESQLHLLSRR